MNRRSERPTLHERIHGTPPPALEPPPPRPVAAEPPIRPCWVTDRYGRLPGLLMEWRRVEAGWQGRVVRPVRDGGVWIVVEEWLPAALLDDAS